jgi:hypothetical protein
VAGRYERNPNVAYTDFNHVFSIASNDTLYKDQWGLHNTGQAVTGSFVRGAPTSTSTPRRAGPRLRRRQLPATGGTLTGIIDTGIERAHADLLNKTKVCATATSATGLVVEGTCSTTTCTARTSPAPSPRTPATASAWREWRPTPSWRSSRRSTAPGPASTPTSSRA